MICGRLGEGDHGGLDLRSPEKSADLLILWQINQLDQTTRCLF